VKSVSSDSFEQECDRLSQTVDDGLFTRLRWERTEAPMLAKLVALAQGALEGRSEFELTEEGATSTIKRFVLKVHSNRIMAIVIFLDGRQVVVGAEAIGRSQYTVAEGPVVAADFDEVDEQWMRAALQEQFARVRS
jgi:hypothetical protein